MSRRSRQRTARRPSASASGITTEEHREILQGLDAAFFGAFAPRLQLVEQLLTAGGRTAPDGGKLLAHAIDRLQTLALAQQCIELGLVGRGQLGRLLVQTAADADEVQ